MTPQRASTKAKPRRDGIEVLSMDEIKLMRRAGLVVAEALGEMTASAKPGMTTREIDAIAVEVLARHGATSSFLGYQPGGAPPYPAVSCLSVNEQVVHGIPGSYVLKDGDLLSIDFGAIVDGYHSDAARSVGIGQLKPEVAELNTITEQAMWAGIAAVGPANTVSDIAVAIQHSILDSGPYGIVCDYSGHGIGHNMHQPPDVPNRRRPGRSPILVVGMCLAIEPMATLGTEQTQTLNDGWTVSTADGSIGCHWENTVAITRRGLWVLTEPDGGRAALARLHRRFAPLAD